MFSDYAALLDSLRRIRGIKKIKGGEEDTWKRVSIKDERFNPAHLSTSMLWESIKRSIGKKPVIGKGALENYIREKVENPNAEALSELERFVYRTSLGRALNSSISTNPHNEISDALAKSESRFNFFGNYLVYHGSYMSKGCFAIRAMRIFRDDNFIVSIEDFIRDSRTKATNPDKIIEAHGCILFWNDRPHMIFNSADNRVGLSLMVCRSPDYSEHKVQEIAGYMIGMNDGNESFHRRVLIVRRDEEINDLKSMTGVFRWQEITRMAKEEGLKKSSHMNNFMRLKEIEIKTAWNDPLLPYKKGPMRGYRSE